MTVAVVMTATTTTTTTTTTRFFDTTRFANRDADEDDDDDDDDDDEEEELPHRVAVRTAGNAPRRGRKAVALTRRVVETIEKEAAAFLSSSALKVKGGDKRERRAKAAKRVLTQHHAERLLQKMLLKMLKIGEEEMAGKIGDGIEQLYRLGKERKEVRTFRMEKKSMVADATASAAEDDEYSDADADDDERTVELREVACSQVGADATKRNPEVQLFRMQFNKGVEVRVHESSWSDAGLAWRIWGSAKVAFKVVDRSAYFRDKNKTYLELGSGCGLIGAAIASLGGRCTVTEGAPGALTALRKTAEGVNDVAKTEAMKVAFLDWRDDLATLEEEKNGTVEASKTFPTTTTSQIYRAISCTRTRRHSITRTLPCVYRKTLVSTASSARI